MKSPASYAPPRRLGGKKPVRLDLRRATPQAQDDESIGQRQSTFWKWFGLVALLHLLAIGIFGCFYAASPAPKPPEQFISLLPDGDAVKGKPGVQQAPKIGDATPAPSVHSAPPPPVPAPQIQPVTPPAQMAVAPPPPVPKPKAVQPKPVINPDAPLVAQDKPVTPPKPKIKVDLTQLVDGPAVAADKPAVKPKPHPKKHVVTAPTNDADTPDQNAASNPDSHGLSREQIARELGQKLQAAGINDAVKIGPSGAPHSQPNSFADFYASIRDQVMSKWEHPNQLNDSAVNPVVQIHVEKDGRVPPESVTLMKSSGDPVYDESALNAAKGLGCLLQPLPDGCPPDIPITFKLTR
jgi:TonB family protein